MQHVPSFFHYTPIAKGAAMKKEELINLGEVKISGNQSVVWGGLEAGGRVATAYSGAPRVSEDNLYQLAATEERRVVSYLS